MTLWDLIVFAIVVLIVVSLPGCATPPQARAPVVNPSVLVKKAPAVPVGKVSQALSTPTPPSTRETMWRLIREGKVSLEGDPFTWEMLLQHKAEAKCSQVHGGVEHWEMPMAYCQDGASIRIAE